MRAAVYSCLPALLFGCVDSFAPSDASVREDATPVVDARVDAGPPEPIISPCIRVTPSRVTFEAALPGFTTVAPLTLSSCSASPLTIQRIEITDGGPAFSLTDDVALPLVLGTDQDPGLTIAVGLHPEAEVAYTGTVLIESDDPERPRLEIPVSGQGVANACPIPRVAQSIFTIELLDIVPLDGSPSSDPDGRIIDYTWIITDAPDGSTAQPVENHFNPERPQDGGRPDNTATPGAFFWADLAGSYTLELRVTDNLDLIAYSGACPAHHALVQITAEP